MKIVGQQLPAWDFAFRVAIAVGLLIIACLAGANRSSIIRQRNETEETAAALTKANTILSIREERNKLLEQRVKEIEARLGVKP